MFSRRVAFAVLLLSFILLNTNFHSSPHATSTSKFRLPAMPGATITVSQGNNQGDHIARYDSEFAFDFKVGPTHFAETAAQGGTVIGFNSSSSIQCSGMNIESSPVFKTLIRCWAYANFVLIADDDGTTAALYVHLLAYSDKTNMPKVTCGEHVNQGDPIGLAGTTGYSTGVHLHFQVESLPSSISISHCQQSDLTSGWWWTPSVPVSFSNPEVLAQDANGIPQTGQSFNVSNSPASKPTPTSALTIDAALHSKTNPYPPYTGQLVLDDPLNHNDGQWQSDAPGGLGLCVFQNGKYILTARKDDGGDAVCPGSQKITGDFTFQIETTFVYQSYIHPSPNDDGALGIDFSPNNGGSDYFRCFINQQGVLSLAFIRPGDNGFYSVTRQIPSFKKDRPNLLAVVVVGEQVTVYLNVVKELTATIPNLGQGHISLEVDFGENSYFPSAAFQNAKLWM